MAANVSVLAMAVIALAGILVLGIHKVKNSSKMQSTHDKAVYVVK
jgi:hypothetical protein